MNPHEIAQHIVDSKGDLLRIGPENNRGSENLYIIKFERDASTPIDCDLPDKLKKEAPAFCALAMARLAYLIESKQPFAPTYAKRFPKIKRNFY